MAWLTHGCFTLVTLLVIVSLSVASLHDTSHSFELDAIQGQVQQGCTSSCILLALNDSHVSLSATSPKVIVLSARVRLHFSFQSITVGALSLSFVTMDN